MILTNPVVVAVLVLLILCLLKVNVMLSMLISMFVGGLIGGLGIDGTLSSIYAGLGGNGETALAYVLLGVFATCLATTGITDILTVKISKVVGAKKYMLLLVLTLVACASQNLIPVHIAYILILIPPLIPLMNKLKIDRRAAACCTAFGLKAPYITLPFGFGLIFHGIIRDNIVNNATTDAYKNITLGNIVSVNWILGLAMIIGLVLAVFVTYRKPREYQEIKIEHSVDVQDEKLTTSHWFALLAIVVVIALQLWKGSLPFAALGGLIVLFASGAIKPSQIDDQFAGGIKLMGFIAFIMIIAGGFAQVLKDTGSVDALVESAVGIMGGSKLVAATVITTIGLIVTMGIGSSFSTVPIVAIFYVPLCEQLGFSPAATIILMSAAAALGDAGSPASDTTLGPTSGLNIDGQHDHIWDTCVPTFIHFNIPLMIAAILAAQIV